MMERYARWPHGSDELAKAVTGIPTRLLQEISLPRGDEPVPQDATYLLRVHSEEDPTPVVLFFPPDESETIALLRRILSKALTKDR